MKIMTIMMIMMKLHRVSWSKMTMKMRVICDYGDHDDTYANLRNVVCIPSACNFPRRRENLVNLGGEATKVGDDQLVPQRPEGNMVYFFQS